LLPFNKRKLFGLTRLYKIKGERWEIKATKSKEFFIFRADKPTTSIKAFVIFQSSLELPTLNKILLVF
jgi:hypothetical protein